MARSSVSMTKGSANASDQQARKWLNSCETLSLVLVQHSLVYNWKKEEGREDNSIEEIHRPRNGINVNEPGATIVRNSSAKLFYVVSALLFHRRNVRSGRVVNTRQQTAQIIWSIG